MILILRGLAGPYQNKHFQVRAGMSLGRRQGDILLEADNTISSLHGRVNVRQNGTLYLKDSGSSNQFMVQNKKVAEVDLIDGAVFQVGQCVFQVLKISEKDLKNFTFEKSWKDVVFGALENNKNLGLKSASSLNPTVKVDCVQGASADISWFLGFGPRLFGPVCEDIEILEKDSADVSFEISQTNMGPSIRVLSQNVLVNRRSVSEKLLEDGDEVQVGSSIFRIRLG